MNSFEALIGKKITQITLNESSTFFIAPLQYNSKHCGKRYPSSKFKLTDIDYFNLMPFKKLFEKQSIFIIWYDENQIITDLEIYHLINDIETLFKDYQYIKKTIDKGEAHKLTEGDTQYLGASRLKEKTPQPNSTRMANKREFVLKKKYLQKIIDEIQY
ncbi:MAG: hypothetical protein E7Z80_00200 [Methanobrevibacter thaueri]|nr:hypothetical protein [Methanobrevibacter thaueri]